MSEATAPKINPGDIMGWPILKIDYPTDREKLRALLPPGIDASSTANVHLSIYCFPVPDEPEYGGPTAEPLRVGERGRSPLARNLREPGRDDAAGSVGRVVRGRRAQRREVLFAHRAERLAQARVDLRLR